MKIETTAAARHEFTLTLISAYRSYKDECAKTGNAPPKKKLAFFSPCLPKQKHNISPIYHFVYVLNVVAV